MTALIEIEPKSRLINRPRRNRKTAAIRSLVEETHLKPQDLIVPFFLIPGTDTKQQIPTLPGIERMTIDLILRQAEELHKKKIPAIALFPVIKKEDKDATGSYALRRDGLIPEALCLLKQELPSLCIVTDVALDPFTSHGHDGVIDENGNVLNDETVNLLAEMALIHAEAGADIVAPSDMMDGRIRAIRQHLDVNHFEQTSLLSYTAKYASSLYAPFRNVVGSQLIFGDKKSYQMNPANIREALLEATLDAQEGADMLMVKPALFYLDVISKIKAQTHLPLGAYHVSGEYAMVMAAHEKGILDASQVFFEALLSIKRAGADFIFTYAVPHVLPLF